jgi:hypothetical protein
MPYQSRHLSFGDLNNTGEEYMKYYKNLKVFSYFQNTCRYKEMVERFL